MGEKKKKNGNGGDGGKKEKKAAEVVTVVLKVDMHCEGCASKIVKCVRGFEGVEKVKSEAAANKLTVTGEVDPSKLREKLQEKTKKKVELISPQPKKDKENSNNNNNQKESKKEDNNNNNNKKKDGNKKSDNEKKPKEAPVTTAVLKLSLHCHGCIEKIHKTVLKTKGVQEMSVDKQKELVTVKGTMDAKALAESLMEKLKRPVEIVPPKKEKDDKDNSNESGKKKKGGGGGGGGGGGEGGQEEGGGGGGGGGYSNMGRMEYMPGQPGFGYGYPQPYPYPYPYPPSGYPVQFHAPQMFSDENPNACTIM